MMSSISAGGLQWQVADQGSGAPLLLIHGFPLSHRMWREQISALSDSYRVIAPDLRGFGQTAPIAAPPSGEPLTMRQFADDLISLLDALIGPQQVTVAGLSMGGYIAWELWANYSQRIAGLILCDTKAAPDTPEAAANRLSTAENVLQHGAEVIAEPMLEKLLAEATRRQRPELAKELRQTILATSPQAIAGALRGMAQRRDARDLLATIDVPTLVIVGEEDAISPPDEMRGIARGIDGARLLVVPEAGHLAPLESPQPVNAAIAEFLAASRGAE